jgi:L-alanine-DL-glutamate epimerase-like enolase superfamily enzyme
VISAIDIALWDLMGKAVNQPIYKLLGAYTDRIPAYIAGGYYKKAKGLKNWCRRWRRISISTPEPSR